MRLSEKGAGLWLGPGGPDWLEYSGELGTDFGTAGSGGPGRPYALGVAGPCLLREYRAEQDAAAPEGVTKGITAPG